MKNLDRQWRNGWQLKCQFFSVSALDVNLSPDITIVILEEALLLDGFLGDIDSHNHVINPVLLK